MTQIIFEGESQYQIVTRVARGRRQHGQADRYAAEQLQDALFRMTGAKLPVRWGEQRLPDRPAILIGQVEPQTEPGLWERDRYEILPEGRDLVLSGSAGRGSLYAVYAFLESLGVRFYGPDDVMIPARREVLLPSDPVRSTAAFNYRHVFYPTAQEPEWAVRWKLNVHDGADLRWGPNAKAHSWGHSFRGLVPPAVHFEKHPEYYSLVDGIRRNQGEQLCCTNPEVAEVACETMARWIAEHPDRRIFAVGMNDWLGWCECPECAAMDEREGTHAAQVLTLVNRVAERFPDRIIATLAYSWTVEAPRKMDARDNVLIVLCHNRACFNHALDKCELNEPFLRDLRGWNQRADHILIWDYYVNYHSYLLPTPNLRRIQADLRTYRDSGVEGMFCQGSAVRGGQFEGLRQYLLARMLWNPDQEAWPIVQEWVRGVYGKDSGEFILQYLEMLHDHVDENHAHMPAYGYLQEIQPAVFTKEVLERGKKLWDQAEQAAASEELRRKVFAARAPEMCSRLFHAGIEYKVEDGRLAPHPEPDFALRDRFVEAAILGNAAHLRENESAPEAFAQNYGRSYDAVVVESDKLRAVIVPEMGGRIFSMTWKDDGSELLYTDDLVRIVNYMPCHCGYEFSLDPAGRGAGSVETYDVIEQDDAHVLLQAELADGLTLQTRYAFSGGQVDLRHVVGNTGSKPVTVSPVTHPEWSHQVFGAEAELSMRGLRDGVHSLALNPEGRRSRDLPFEGDAMPQGEWWLRSTTHPLELKEVFNPKVVARTRLNLAARKGSVGLELHFQPVEIAPGKEHSFETKWVFGQTGAVKK